MEETPVHLFHWLDYMICVIMLLVSIGIGLFYGFCHTSQSTQEYLTGGHKMPLIPVAMSLIASFISGISTMGIPAETYFYGIQYVYILSGVMLSGLLFGYVYLPVFYNLGITSIFEYLERRFDKNIRILTSILFTVKLVAWLPIVIYVPALAFNQVAGINIHIVTPIICLICIFYTSLGGIKAVVWTDVIQGISMFGATLVVAIKGTIDLGGFNVVWEKNLEGGRIEPPVLDPSFMTRHTFWALCIGSSVHYLQCAALHQTMFQRYVSLPSLTTARRAILIFIGGMFVSVGVGTYIGNVMYATYYDCDPWSTNRVEKKEQILILLVMKVMSKYPGLLGVFVAGILSASLSSLSTGLNSMAAVVLEDFCHVFYKKPLSEKKSSIIMKLTTVILGIACVLMVYLVEKLGSILQLSLTLSSIGSGPALGIFTIGILLPWVKRKGVLVGGISSLIFMTYLCGRAQIDIASGQFMFEQKALSTAGCTSNFTLKNATIYTKPTAALHHISYLWYTLAGAICCIIISLIYSFIMENTDPNEIDSELLSPIIRRFFRSAQIPVIENDNLKETKYHFNYNNAKELVNSNLEK